jgi:hypothetical protein
MNVLVAPRIAHLHGYSQNEFMGIQFVLCVMHVHTYIENPPAGSLNPIDVSVTGKDLEDLELHDVHAGLLRPPPVCGILTDGLSFALRRLKHYLAALDPDRLVDVATVSVDTASREAFLETMRPGTSPVR